jgi:hypothetical protein
MNPKKAIILISALSFCYNGLQAQHWNGINQSNYNGTHAFYFSTAMSVSSPNSFSFNGLGHGMNLHSNYLSYDLPFSLTAWMTGNVDNQYKNSQGKIDYKKDWFVENLDGKTKHVDFSTESRGPAFMYNFDRKASIGIFSRSRTGFQGYGIPENMARILRYGLNNDGNNPLFNQNGTPIEGSYPIEKTQFNLHSYSEYGLGGAYALVQNTYMTFSIGANVKYLLGKGIAFFSNNATTFEIIGYDTVRFTQTDFNYGYAGPDYFSNLKTINFLNGQNLGKGWGFDLSAYLELKKPMGKVGSRVKIEDVNYWLRAGVSLLDIGSLSYNQNVINKSVSSNGPQTFVAGAPFAQAWAGGFAPGMQFMDSTLQTLFTFTDQGEIKSQLPTTIALHGDLKIVKSLFVGAQIYQSLIGKESPNFRRPSALNVIPRFEIKGVEISTPVSLFQDYTEASVGAFVRFGPFFFGSNNLISTLSATHVNGLNFYTGFSYGIGNSKKQDRR